MLHESYDCIVMGGGPAGSTVAALVAQAGYSTLLVEREKMPRFHVGESLMPETWWTFERLGVLDAMRTSKFVKKVSVQFVSNNGKESSPFDFRTHDPRECSVTWQVERADFDKMLFDNAAAKGARCCDETRVLDVLFEPGQAGQPPRASGVRLQTAGGPEREIAARVVVDATGLQGLLSNKLGMRVPIPELKKAAVWGYYRGARRDFGDFGGSTIILHSQDKKSWFWFIPLGNNITSIGVVGDVGYLFKRARKNANEIFEDELVKCPALVDRLLEASLVSDFHVVREFSATTRQHAGPGWVLVGDAFAFIDPIYSSGVFFAFKSGELAADAIIDGLQKNDLSGEQLGRWCESFKAGTKWILQLVSAYYTDAFSFGEFMRAHPHHKGNLTDLLIGRIFHPEAGDIFNDMNPWLARANSGSPA